MRLHVEQARLPSIQRVAFRAFTLACARLKLSFVRIGNMAIHALGVCDRRLKVSMSMAIGASHGAMLSQQRIICF